MCSAGYLSEFSMRTDTDQGCLRLHAVYVPRSLPDGQLLHVAAMLRLSSGQPLSARCTCVIGERGRCARTEPPRVCVLGHGEDQLQTCRGRAGVPLGAHGQDKSRRGRQPERGQPRPAALIVSLARLGAGSVACTAGRHRKAHVLLSLTPCNQPPARYAREGNCRHL